MRLVDDDYWWQRRAGENLWMEITRRDDIGADLKAPAAARGGVITASYALVPLVQPGDVVVHYDSRQEAIVAVSIAASAAEPAPIYWVARGSYARRAGEQLRWLPGLRVTLDLVVNHPSDQHPWFASARSDPDSPFRDWYVRLNPTKE